MGKAGCAEKRVAVLGWQSIEPARDTKSARQTPRTELSNNPTPTRRQYRPAQTGRQYRWAKVATEVKPTPSNPKHNESQRCCCRLLATRLEAWPVGCAARSKHLGSMELQWSVKCNIFFSQRNPHLSSIGAGFCADEFQHGNIFSFSMNSL